MIVIPRLDRGIQSFEVIISPLDTGFHRWDDFLRVCHSCANRNPEFLISSCFQRDDVRIGTVVDLL